MTKPSPVVRKWKNEDSTQTLFGIFPAQGGGNRIHYAEAIAEHNAVVWEIEAMRKILQAIERITYDAEGGPHEPLEGLRLVRLAIRNALAKDGAASPEASHD